MNIALWVIATLLTVAFLYAGAMKLVQPKEKLVAAGYDFVNDISTLTVKVIGTLEVLAAGGLTLPAALDIAPVVVPIAAVGVVLLMVGATVVHLRRHETQPVVVTVTLLALAALVVWGRLGPQSFTS